MVCLVFMSVSLLLILLLHHHFSGHLGGNLYSHEVEKGRGEIRQFTIAGKPVLIELVVFIVRYVAEGNRVGCMGCEGLSVLVEHHVAVSVVCRDQKLTLYLKNGLNYLIYASVQGFNGLNGCFSTPV